MTLNGISTDGDNTPGCAGGGSAAQSAVTMTLHPEFAAQLGDAAAFADCHLSPEEIATSPAAADFALAFRTQVAASLGVPIEDVVLNGITTDGDPMPGCQGGETGRRQLQSGKIRALCSAGGVCTLRS